MNSNKQINWKYYEKTINGMHFNCSFNGELIVWGNYLDNPHSENNEDCIHFREFLDGTSHNSQRCRNHIKQYFGDEKLESFIYNVQQQYDLLKK